MLGSIILCDVVVLPLKTRKISGLIFFFLRASSAPAPCSSAVARCSSDFGGLVLTGGLHKPHSGSQATKHRELDVTTHRVEDMAADSTSTVCLLRGRRRSSWKRRETSHPSGLPAQPSDGRIESQPFKAMWPAANHARSIGAERYHQSLQPSAVGYSLVGEFVGGL